MSNSAKIRYLIDASGMKQADFLNVLGMGSKQSLSNKFVNERWSLDDVIKIAEATGSKLAIIRPNGEQIVFSADNAESEE